MFSLMLDMQERLVREGLTQMEAERYVNATDFTRALDAEVDHLKAEAKRGRTRLPYRQAVLQAETAMQRALDDALADRQEVSPTWALHGLLTYRPGCFWALLVGAAAIECLKIKAVSKPDPDTHLHMFRTFAGLPPGTDTPPVCGAVLTAAYAVDRVTAPRCPDCVRILAEASASK